MKRFASRLLVALTGLGLLTPVGVPASAGAPSGRGSTGPVPADHTVTLITGDQVMLRGGRASGGEVAEVRPGPGRAGMTFHTSRNGGRHRVVPIDALPYLSDGSLDHKLFDVTFLAAHGLHDQASSSLPLLFRTEGATRSVRQAIGDGARLVREIPLVGTVAVSQQRRSVGGLWRRWTSGQLSGVDKIWLDGVARIHLDRSAAQIGAPAAWQAGGTGKGVRVAVLDSGYDPGHRDLAGSVVGAKDFTGENTVLDRDGHGTHVASIVAGTGVASAGRRKGIAPDADLLIGRVCTEDGCPISAVLAGMEWAVAEGARVVNLSLGTDPTDGTDPLSEAVDKLTRRTGALFVVSVGNSGAGGQRISAPAGAAEAVAVGSVTKSDTISWFSSTGPRFGDLGLKPDLAAPGSGIVAARAAGTLDGLAVDDHYAELSGTSMAAPHVAGAAAVLAQFHPDWKAAQLRSALTGAAKGLSGLAVYQQGAGRLDLARALTQPVRATPAAVDLGTAAHPHEDDAAMARTVTYANDSSEAVTLRIRLQMSRPGGGTAPDGMFGLSSRTVLVPAHGEAAVQLEARPATDGPDGAYGGWIVAEGDGVTVRTAVGLNKEVPSYDLTVRMLDRAGNPALPSADGPGRTGGTDGTARTERGRRPGDNTEAGRVTESKLDQDQVAYAELTDVESGLVFQGEVADGSLRFRLPRGTYALHGVHALGDDQLGSYREVTSFLDPVFEVDGNAELVLDARSGREVELKAPQAGASLATASIGYVRQINDEAVIFGAAVVGAGANGTRPTLWLAGGPAAGKDEFTGFGHAVWARPSANPQPHRDAFLDSPYLYHDVRHWPGHFPSQPSLVTAPEDYVRVDARYAAITSGEAGHRRAFPVLAGAAAGTFSYPAAVTPAVEMNLPFRRAEYYAVRDDVRWSFDLRTYRYPGSGPETEELSIVKSRPVGYRAGRTVVEHWNAGVFGPALPTGEVGDPRSWPFAPWAYRDGDQVLVSTPVFSDGGPGRWGDRRDIASERTELYRNGQLLRATDQHVHQNFALPPEDAAYRLVKEIDPGGRFRLSTKVRMDWRFRSARTTDGEQTALPLLTVRYTPALDDHNRAPGGRFVLPIAVESQDGVTPSPITALTVEASYDDGRSWVPAPVRRSGSGWTAALEHPGSGFVTLRAKAGDAAGRQVEQTITRAYEIG